MLKNQFGLGIFVICLMFIVNTANRHERSINRFLGSIYFNFNMFYCLYYTFKEVGRRTVFFIAQTVFINLTYWYTAIELKCSKTRNHFQFPNQRFYCINHIIYIQTKGLDKDSAYINPFLF